MMEYQTRPGRLSLLLNLLRQRPRRRTFIENCPRKRSGKYRNQNCNCKPIASTHPLIHHTENAVLVRYQSPVPLISIPLQYLLLANAQLILLDIILTDNIHILPSSSKSSANWEWSGIDKKRTTTVVNLCISLCAHVHWVQAKERVVGGKVQNRVFAFARNQITFLENSAHRCEYRWVDTGHGTNDAHM